MTRSQPTDDLARNVRRVRDQRSLSLSELARRSRIAKATLSAIENGNGNPTVTTLRSLARALRVPVAELVGPVEIGSPRLVRGAGGDPGTDDLPVEAFVPDGVVELYDLRYEPGDRAEFGPHGAGVVERVLAQSGSVRVGPVGDAEVLRSGDFLAFPADQPHVYEAVGDDAFRGTLVVTYPVTAPEGSPIHAETR